MVFAFHGSTLLQLFVQIILGQRIFSYIYVVVQFYPWFKFYFPLFLGMVMYDDEFETKGNKILKIKDKIEPPHAHIYIYIQIQTKRMKIISCNYIYIYIFFKCLFTSFTCCENSSSSLCTFIHSGEQV